MKNCIVTPCSIFMWASSLTVFLSIPAFAQEPPEGSFVIEAEDWNYDGGEFIDDPSIGFGADSYFARGVDDGEPDVDFKENTPTVRIGNEQAEGYRAPSFPDEVGLPQSVASLDGLRDKFDGENLPDFDLTLTEKGEWVNYTRTFPAGDYEVRARIQNVGNEAFSARLDEVVGDRTEPNQATRVRGYFFGDNSADYEWVTMTDFVGEPVTVSLSGIRTVRVTTTGGSYNANYFAFVPMAGALPLPGTADIVNPEADDGFVPGGSIQIDAEGEDLEGITKVEFVAIPEAGAEIILGEATDAPFSFTWNTIPEGIFELVTRVTDGDGIVSQSEAVRVFIDGTPPQLVSAGGDGSLMVVDIVFNEPVSQGAADPANYAITSGADSVEVTGAELSEDGLSVRLTTAAQTVGTEYTLTIANVRDRGNNAIAEGTSAQFYGVGPLLQTDAGFVIFEAEAFDRNIDGLWEENTTHATPSGGVSMTVPDGSPDNESSTVMEYDIKFVKSGTHYIWIRASADDSGTNDSVWLHLNGARPIERENGNSASMSGFNNQPEFVWRSDSQDGPDPMSFDLDEAGVHTIGIASREDGALIDKVVISTDLTFDPNEFGEFGPAVTGREGEPQDEVGEVEITLQPVSVSAIEGTLAQLTSEVTGLPEFPVSQQWQRFDGDEWLDVLNATGSLFTVEPLTFDWNGAQIRMVATTTGAEAISDTVAITVIPDTTPPSVVRAVGRRPSGPETVQIVFSEPVLEEEASVAASYSITGPNEVDVVSVTVLAGGRAVEVETDGQVVGRKYSITAAGLKDLAAVPNTMVDGDANFYSYGDFLPQDENGLLVFEAENFTNNLDELWIEERERGTPSGGIAMVNPNGTGGNEASTQLEYELEFTQTGEHIIWYRAGAANGTDDSAWLWIDGARPLGREDGNLASMTGFNGELDYRWISNPQEGGGQMTFEIDDTGEHTIALARREDGAVFDKFVITTDPGYDPRNSGTFGPPETREGVLPLPTIEITGPDFANDFQTGSSLTFEVDISQSDRVIDRVEFFSEGVKIGEATSAPWNFTWRNLPEGIWQVTAVVVDDVEDRAQAEMVEVFVSGEPVVAADPLIITNLVFGDAGSFTISWSGGKAPYTVEFLDGQEWDALQTTDETSATLTGQGAVNYYRITSE